MIGRLKEELHTAKAWNAQYQKQLTEHGELMSHLCAATLHNQHLKEENARLEMKYVAEREQLIGHLRAASGEVQQLRAEHAAENAQLKQQHAAENAQLKQELAAENAELKEELAAEVEQLKKENYAKGVRDMRQLALDMYPNAIDPSVLSAELLLEPDYYVMGCSPVRAEDSQ